MRHQFLLILLLSALPGCAAAAPPTPPTQAEVEKAATPLVVAEPVIEALEPKRVLAEVVEAATPTPVPAPIPTPEAVLEPPTAETQRQDSGAAPFTSRYNLPPVDWAEQELARRGFVRVAGKRVVALDPGHGGPEVGAANGSQAEKSINLAIAQHLKTLLEEDGYLVVLTREDEGRAFTFPENPAGTSRGSTRGDLQARIDIANAAKADIFVSIHNNGSSNTEEAGTEVWFAPDRPFGEQSSVLAEEVLDGIITELSAAGYASPNRGLKNGSRFRVFRNRVFPLFVLGKPREAPRATRATEMPGILGESLFLSNPYEASLLAQDKIRLAIASGYQRGINRYFELLEE